MKSKPILTASCVAFFISILTVGCDLIDKLTEHEIVIEENAYLRGTTSAQGFVNLMDYAIWRDNKSRIKEVTEVKIEYRVSRNDSPADVSVNFYFGEDQPNILLGSVFLPQGQTHSDLVPLSLGDSTHQMIDLIMSKDAFWYSAQGTTEASDIDFEPVRITIKGTFDIL